MLFGKRSGFQDLILLHPFIFATLPALQLGAVNLDELSLRLILYACITSVVFGGVIFLTSLFWTRSKVKAALYTTLLILTLSYYGPLLDFTQTILGVNHNSRSLFNWLFSGLWAVICFGVFFSIRKLSREFQNINFILFGVGLTIVGALVFQYAALDSFNYRIKYALSRFFPVEKNSSSASSVSPESTGTETTIQKVNQLAHEKPNVYYLILDGYPRADWLSKVYQYKNDNFLEKLRERGFYLANKSRSNYPVTDYSIASSMNMMHVNNVPFTSSPQKIDHFYQLIKEPRVAKQFKALGYEYNVVASFWGPLYQKPNIADVYYMPWYHRMHPYYVMILEKTPIKHLLSNLTARQHLYQLDKIEQIASQKKNGQFIFSHIVMPHIPYCFEETGKIRNYSSKDKWSEKEFFVGQLKFLNDRILKIVDTILNESSVPPIIILQGDHGTAALSEENIGGPETKEQLHERYSILNAILVPDSTRQDLYATMTPVNTFRLIFKNHFDLDYRLVDDKQYFSWYFEFKDFIDVTHKLDS